MMKKDMSLYSVDDCMCVQWDNEHHRRGCVCNVFLCIVDVRI